MPLDDDVTLGDHLLDVQRALLAELYDRLAVVGFADLTLETTALFKDVAPGGSTLADVSARAQLGRGTVQRAAESLAERGYAELDGDTVRLTEKGWAAVGAGRRALRDIEAGWEQRIGAERFAVFADVLADITAWQRGRPRS
jgi:Mn-dependent DtxR family transcriptional regulator